MADKPQTLADRIRQIHRERASREELAQNFNDLTNEDLIDLISEADDLWINSDRDRSRSYEGSILDPDFEG